MRARASVLQGRTRGTCSRNCGVHAVSKDRALQTLVAPSLLLLIASTGCGDGDADSGGGETGGGPGIDPTAPSGSDSSSGDPNEDGSSSGPDDTSGGAEACMTVLCGPAGTCCGADEDCVADQCQPACASGVRCGEAQDVCCDAGQVCLANTCEDAGEPCIDSFDCGEGFFCEPTLDKCLPQLDPVECEVIPEFEEIAGTL